MCLRITSSCVIRLLSLGVMIAVIYPGCRPGKQTELHEGQVDLARTELQDIVNTNRDPHGRASVALARLSNGNVDSVPFPVFVELGCRDNNEPVLYIMCLDEDRDLRGIRIREDQADPNAGTVTLQEDYPLYVAWPETLVLDGRAVPVCLRKTLQQRKDEDSWAAYLVLVLEDLVREFVYKELVNETVKLPPKDALSRQMPAVLISVPEPNETRILVSVYDNDGHKSDPIPVDISPRSYRILKEMKTPE